MWGWLLASMSGFTRMATRATRPSRAATASTRASSPADSTLIAFRPSGDRALELGARLADAGEHDVRRGEARLVRELDLPDRSWRRRALPSARSRRAIASVEFAFSA